MNSAKDESWLVPAWSGEDLKIIRGELPNNIELCSSSSEARLYLAFKARSRIQNFVLGRIGWSPRNIAYQLRRIRQELAIAGLAAANVTANRSLQTLHRSIVNFIALNKDSLNAKHSIIKVPALASVEPVGNRWLQSALEIEKEISRIGGTLLLQGSQADGKTTYFSDIDFWLIGDMGNGKLASLKKNLDDVVTSGDPLQHHGVFWVNHIDAQAYWPMQLPVETLQRSRALNTPKTLEITEYYERYGAASHLLAVVKQWQHFLVATPAQLGMWSWKFRLSELMLIPTLLASAGGRNIYKGDSFDFAKPLYSYDAWQAMQLATRARDVWPSCTCPEHYLREPLRSKGQLKHDRWAIEESVDLLLSKDFTQSTELFLQETIELLRL